MELTRAEFIQILDERLEFKLEEKLELKLEEKLEQKLNQKLEEKLEIKLEQKLNQKLEIKLEQKLETKLEEKLNNKLDQKFAAHTAELKSFVITHVSEKIDVLALMVKREFDNIDVQFSRVNHRLDALEGKPNKYWQTPPYK